MSDRGQRKDAVAGGKAIVADAVATVPAEVISTATIRANIGGEVNGTNGTNGANGTNGTNETNGANGTNGTNGTNDDAGLREDVDDGDMPPSSSYITRKLSLPLIRRRSAPQGSEAQPSSSDALDEDAEFAVLRLTFSSPAVFPDADGDGDGGDDDGGAMRADGIVSDSVRQANDDGCDGGAEVSDATLVGRLRAELRQAQDELAAQRRRGEHERDDLAQFAKSEMIGEILPVLDDLERASVQVPARLRDDPWVMGVLMIGHSVRAMLERQGVERIAPWQGLFDPRLHEAVSRVHDPAVPVNTVTDVYRPGYALHGRVLRPAQVQVAVTQPVEREEDQ